MKRTMYTIVYYDLEQLQNCLLVLKSKDNFQWCEHFVYAYCLHDKDVSRGNSFKKAHYHLVLKFQVQVESTRLYEVIKEYLPNKILTDINKADIKAFSYLIHANTPDKHQYDFADIVSNLDSDDLFDYVEKYRKVKRCVTESVYVSDLLFYIEENNITNFRQLIVRLSADTDYTELLGFCIKNVYLVRCLFDVR